MKVVVTGATGMVGEVLTQRLIDKGHEVWGLTRNVQKARKSNPKVSWLEWHPNKEPAPASAFQGADGVVHLSGENVGGGRWTEERKKAILKSREEGTKNLVTTLNNLPQGPKVAISASAIGIYGDRGDESLTENSDEGQGFLADVCRAWENNFSKLNKGRSVILRIGIVLSPKGGALAKMLPIFKLGAGGPVGSGNQWMSWIHLEDVVGLIIQSLENEKVSGIINAVSPNPVTNREFTKALADTVHRPAIFPAPAFALKLVLGEMSALVLHSQRVQAKNAEQLGLTFKFTQLREALSDLLPGKKKD